MEFKVYLKKRQDLVNSYLRKYLAGKKANSSCPQHLHKAMSYSLMAGGKRLRAILAIASYETSGLSLKNILPAAASIELIHTYSLIHDDLPAMDNDDFRRNKPTSHRVFGEAAAILAGDALLTDAFGIIAGISAKPGTVNDIIKEIAYACGPDGMVGGQMADILSEDKKISARQLLYIHTHKTGALIRASVRTGALMAEVPREILNALTKYGENIGLAYQIADDILDIVGSKKELGKSTGTDTSRGKNTYPSLFGLEESQGKAENLIEGALNAIHKLDRKADPLREIANYIIRRRN